MPFIKYSQSYETPSGPATRIKFVNVDHIVMASYDEKGRTLKMIVARSHGEETIELDGDDAQIALDKLQSL